MEKLIRWLIKTFLKGYSLHRNPPKGQKKPRKGLYSCELSAEEMSGDFTPITTGTAAVTSQIDTATGMLKPEDEGKTWNYTERGMR
jgi:hypothetical protein